MPKPSNSPLLKSLKRIAQDTPDAPALWIGHLEYLSHLELSLLVEELSTAILSFGIVHGQRIAVAVPRGNSALVGILGALNIGPICPLDGKLKVTEYVEALKSLDADCLLMYGASVSAQEAAQSLGIPALSYNVDFKSRKCHLNAAAKTQSVNRSTRLDLKFKNGSSPEVLMRTSGTTGQPKIVGLSGENMMSAAKGMKDVFKLVPDDVCVTPMPLHHVHGLIAGALSSLLAGSSVHCCESFSPDDFDQALSDYSPTWLTASPALHLAMRDYYEHHKKTPNAPRLTRFRSSSAPLAASAIESLEKLFMAPLIETYGLTETASTICSNLLPPGKRKLGSVGTAINAELAIVDDQGKAAIPMQVGEITLAGKGVIEEYLGSSPADGFLEGRLCTGDVGYLDHDGYLYIVGRKKELIKRGGHSVYPMEIDDALIQCEGVLEAAAFSVPHDTLGEDLLAAIVVKAGVAVDPAQTVRELGKLLSSYKVPTQIFIVDQLPKNPIGKVLRREIPRVLGTRLLPAGEAPADDMESRLLAIWRDILHRADIGVTDNVFLFGGDPLRAQMFVRAASAVGIKTDTKSTFDHPTVRIFAKTLSSTKELA